jgi:hypothetical protein
LHSSLLCIELRGDNNGDGRRKRKLKPEVGLDVGFTHEESVVRMSVNPPDWNQVETAATQNNERINKCPHQVKLQRAQTRTSYTDDRIRGHRSSRSFVVCSFGAWAQAAIGVQPQREKKERKQRNALARTVFLQYQVMKAERYRGDSVNLAFRIERGTKARHSFNVKRCVLGLDHL